MKRLLISLLVIVLLVPTLAGAQDDKITIKFMGWGGPTEQEVFQAMIDGFEAKNPNVEVEYILVPPAEFQQKLTTLAAADDLPDVFYMADGWFSNWVSKDLLLPIEDMVPQEELDNIWTPALQRYSWDGEVVGQGTLYCLPKDLGPFVMVYNKDLYDKYGVEYPPVDGSWTWDKALEDYKALTEFDENGNPISFGVGAIPAETVIWGNGADFLNEDRTRVMTDDPKFIEGIQWLADLANVHHVMPNAADLAGMNAWEMWLAGKVANFVMGPWDQPTFWELDFAWDIGVFPTSPNTGMTASWTGSMGFAVSAGTEHPEEAVALALYFSADEEGQRTNYEMGQAVPNRIDMAFGEFLEYEKDPQNRYIFLENILEWGHPTPGNYTSNDMWLDTMWQELAPVWDGEMSMEDWAAEWNDYLTDLLNQEEQIIAVPFEDVEPPAEWEQIQEAGRAEHEARMKGE